ncbi:MAG: GxxExxY protein [Chitinophagaceae bacterium]
MFKKEYLYSDITELIIGFAMRVYNKLGFGLPEYFYQRAFVIEFYKINLTCQREMELQVYYDTHLFGKRESNFLVNEKALPETKALMEYDLGKSNPFLNYLEVLFKAVGSLIHFGKPRLELKRYINYKL